MEQRKEPSSSGFLKQEQVYRPQEIARVLRVSPVTLSRAIHSGKLKAFRVGGQWRILGSDLMQYLDAETIAALANARSDSGRPLSQADNSQSE